MCKRISMLFAALLLWGVAQAEVKLPAIFADGMVMQQECAANLWGTATPNKVVKIKASWNNRTIQVKADEQGSWKAVLDTPVAGGPYTLSFSDGKETLLNNVLVGEVWLCSGQSNMEMPMKGFKNQPVQNGNMDALASTNSQIRLFTVKRNSSFTAATDVVGSWSEAKPETVREFSATAYYFGRLVQGYLKVPVGLVVAAWGGSACEAWMNPDWLRAFPTVKLPQAPEDIKSKNRTPTVLYQGMLRPLIGMSMRGVIWYQGEDNYNRASNYADLFSRMIAGWRSEWNQGEFPFYYCQIAPYDYGIITEKGVKVINSAFLREQQAEVEQRVPHTGMAVLLDAGSEKGIHPAQKQVAGERLALLALAKTYGVKGVHAASPTYKSMEVKSDTVVVSFERADMWVNCKDRMESSLFELAGEDQKFYPATARIERSKVIVKSDSVSHPVAVRYAFKNYVMGDLFGEELPVSSFRSDNWKD